MDSSKLISEQAQIAQDITADFDNFKKRLQEEGSCTRSVYQISRAYLDDAFDRFKKNHEKLMKLLNGQHEYFVHQKFEATEFVVNAFLNLLDLPIKDVSLYKPDAVNKTQQASEGIVNQDPPPGERINDPLNGDQDDSVSQHASLSLFETGQVDYQKEMLSLQQSLQEVRAQLGLETLQQLPRRDLTTDLAELLYDIREKREDDVPEFDDDILKWMRFKCMFELSVHNKRIPDLQKFSILNKKLTGDQGKAIIDGILYDPSHYEQAWAAVKRHFHNPAILLRIEVEEFLAQPSMPNAGANKGAMLRELFNRSNRFMTNLKSIFSEGQTLNDEELRAQGFNAMIVFTMENRMDDTTKLQWRETIKDKRQVAKFEELMEFVEQRAANMEYYATDHRQ